MINHLAALNIANIASISYQPQTAAAIVEQVEERVENRWQQPIVASAISLEYCRKYKRVEATHQ